MSFVIIIFEPPIYMQSVWNFWYPKSGKYIQYLWYWNDPVLPKYFLAKFWLKTRTNKNVHPMEKAPLVDTLEQLQFYKITKVKCTLSDLPRGVFVWEYVNTVLAWANHESINLRKVLSWQGYSVWFWRCSCCGSILSLV